LQPGALDHEPQHNRYLAQEGGKGAVKDHILSVAATVNP
jgi:hypothetical protein